MYQVFGDDGELTSDAESIRPIVHDRTVVIGESSSVRVLLNVEIQLNARTGMGVLPQHQQCLITIDSGLNNR